MISFDNIIMENLYQHTFYVIKNHIVLIDFDFGKC